MTAGITLRKDAVPEQTIKNIEGILSDNGIETRICNYKNFGDQWFSCSVQLNDMQDLSTNGKGVKESYAIASAYAEMLERIQSGVLLDNLYPSKKDAQRGEKAGEDIEELLRVYTNYFPRFVQGKTDELSKLLQFQNGFEILYNYYDVVNKKIIKLPDKFIIALCGSNGLASGNTKEEAFLQGTCEIFERYVNKIIHYDSYGFNEFPVIGEKYYANTHAHKLIQLIENKGYTVIVKDCTLNGLLPVIGVIILNSTKTRYYFGIGSDFNMDICIQRCITEIFQGKDINNDFRYHMHSFSDDNYGFWYLNNKQDEFARSIRNGSGKLPRRFFSEHSKYYNDELVKPFVYEEIDNKDAVRIINDLLVKLNINVYIKDYSYLGFDSMRIYIPNMSEIPICKDEDVIDVYNKYKELINAYSSKNIKKLREVLDLLLKEPVFSNVYKTSALLNINKAASKDSNCILDEDIRYLLAMLNLSLHKYNEALHCLKEYHKICNVNSRYAYLQIMSMEAVVNDVIEDEFYEYVSVTATASERNYIESHYNRFVELKKNGFDIDNCSNCDICNLNKLCNYEKWLKITDRLMGKRNEYEASYMYVDALYLNLDI